MGRGDEEVIDGVAKYLEDGEEPEEEKEEGGPPPGIPLAPDIISPMLAIIGNLTNDGTTMHCTGGGRSGAEVAGYLRSRGVETWAWMCFTDGFVFSVQKKKERYCRYLLQSAGML